MTIRKFGTSDEQKVQVDGGDDQGIQKSSANSTFTDRDREQLRRESADIESDQDR